MWARMGKVIWGRRARPEAQGPGSEVLPRGCWVWGGLGKTTRRRQGGGGGWVCPLGGAQACGAGGKLQPGFWVARPSPPLTFPSPKDGRRRDVAGPAVRGPACDGWCL